MRILQINSVVNSGSTGKIAEYIGEVFINAGHESYIAFGRKANASKSNLIKIGTSFDVNLHKIQTLLTDKHALFSVNATKKFLNQIESLKPDLILLHNLHGYYVNYKLLFEYLKHTNLPVIWTLFDCWAFTGHCTYFDDIACVKWKQVCHACPKLHKYPQSLWRDNSANNFKLKQTLFSIKPNLHLITHSVWLKKMVQQSFLGNHPIHHIYSGIDTQVFTNIGSKWQFNTNKKIVLGVASIWDLRKGLQDFIQLSKLLSDDFLIVLIGLSKKQQKDLPGGIHVINRTENQDQLASIYRAATVFVNPTLQDNFPTTNLEALACGLPVITYNAGGSAEAIDEETGVVVEKGNVEQLKKAINDVCYTWDLDKSSKHCRDRALTFFDAKNQYLEYLKIGEKLVNHEKY